MPSDCRYENSGYDNQHLSNDFTQELRGQDKARTQLHTQRLKTAGRSNKKHRGEKLTGDEEIEFSLQLHLPRDSQPITEDPEVISERLKKTLAARPVVPRTVKTMLDDPIREFDRVMAEYEKAQPAREKERKMEIDAIFEEQLAIVKSLYR